MKKRAPDPCSFPSIITSTRVLGKRPQQTGLELGSYTNSQPSQSFQVARVHGAWANQPHCPGWFSSGTAVLWPLYSRRPLLGVGGRCWRPRKSYLLLPQSSVQSSPFLGPALSSPLPGGARSRESTF